MAINKYTGRTIRNVEKRMTTVFPAMVFCETCKCYYQSSCSNHTDKPKLDFQTGEFAKTYWDKMFERYNKLTAIFDESNFRA